MSLLSCSLGHPNLSSHRFCQQCGENLEACHKRSPGVIVHERYQIIRELGRGGFGHTYLVEDTHRFNERCVLKAFAPVVQSGQALQKAKELFEREAGVLYRLQHPQIPRFREWFIESGQDALYLVQDYVAGQTYQAILSDRQQQNKTFTEAEILQLLRQVLPVLDYIHQQGVIHRDISPDNLICRQEDQLPVLIDFGGVKQANVVGAQAQTEGRLNSPTLLGKPGYAPDEQLRFGKVAPHSDIYALAVTALVLLVGKEPQAFFDLSTRTFRWQQEIHLSPALNTMFDRMLAANPTNRYQTVTEVLADLEHNFSPQPSTTQKTLALAARVAADSTDFFRTVLGKARRKLVKLVQTALIVLAIAALGSLGLMAAWFWVQNLDSGAKNSSSDRKATPSFSQEERSRKETLLQRQEALGVDSRFFNRLVNEAFYRQYPEARGRLLTSDPADAQLRANWDEVGLTVLTALEALSPETRDRLGTYTQADLAAWKSKRRANLSQDDFYKQVDRQFFDLLPMYQSENLQGTAASQLWYALAAEKLRAD